jgi:hypothetical protein
LRVAVVAVQDLPLGGDDFRRHRLWETTMDDIMSPNGNGVEGLGSDEEIAAARKALAPVQAAMTAAGFYAYATVDEQNRWTIAADSEEGHVDVRVGADGFVVELWNSSPGLFADEEQEFRQRVLERVARMTVPRIAQGLLEPHQSAVWDEVERGVVVRIAYDLPFGRADDIGAFVRARLPELDALLTTVERHLTS